MNHCLENIRRQVQTNCHIADARHAGDYTMCTYLLKMREFYRWEHGLGFTAALPKERLGAWLAEREQLWDELEDVDYHALDIDGSIFEPFATTQINQALRPMGLVYSAGLGVGGKAHFYLAELQHRECAAGGFELHMSNREYARCLTAPPAMATDHGIFLRKEALRRYLWEKYESWAWSRADSALGKAFSCYAFDADAEQAIAQMAEVEMAAAREHELGEYEAAKQLGGGWNAMLLDLVLSPAELMARAVKDHLADALRTWPMLLQSRQEASLHFYLGNLSGMRRYLAPDLFQAYACWCESRDWAVLERAVDGAEAHWRELAEQMLAVHQRLGVGSAETLRHLVLEYCSLEVD